ncbi:MAG: hypothetical protein JST26_01100 [Bacteroidetes bacterium]|nr:hypothetical protein [Bacteroidota bacterium]
MKNFNFTTATVCQQTEIAKDSFNKASLALFFISIFMLVTLHVKSQDFVKRKPVFGAGLNAQISGDGHGTFYTAYGQIRTGNNIFSLGACLQKRSSQLCGGRFTFTRVLTGKELNDCDSSDLDENYNVSDNFRRVQLTIFGYVQYVNNIPLSYRSAQTEDIATSGTDRVMPNYSKAKLSTVEGGAGIGLNFKLSKNLIWGNYIGAGTYYYTKYTQGMYKDRIMPMVILGTSFSFSSLR